MISCDCIGLISIITSHKTTLPSDETGFSTRLLLQGTESYLQQQKHQTLYLGRTINIRGINTYIESLVSRLI